MGTSDQQNHAASRALQMVTGVLLLASALGAANCAGPIDVPSTGPAPRVGLVERLAWVGSPYWRSYEDMTPDSVLRSTLQKRQWLLDQIVDEPDDVYVAAGLELGPYAYLLTLAMTALPDDIGPDTWDFLYRDLLHNPAGHRGVVISGHFALLDQRSFEVRLGGTATLRVHEGKLLGPGPQDQPQYFIFQWIEREGAPEPREMFSTHWAGRFLKNRPYRREDGSIWWVPVLIGPAPTDKGEELSIAKEGFFVRYVSRRIALEPFSESELVTGPNVDYRPVIDVTAEGAIRLNLKPITPDDLRAALQAHRQTLDVPEIPAVILRIHPQAQIKGTAKTLLDVLNEVPIRARVRRPYPFITTVTNVSASVPNGKQPLQIARNRLESRENGCYKP